MGMQHTGLARDAVYGRMDIHGRWLDRMAPSQLVAISVDHHNIVCLHLTPVQATRVQQKLILVAGHFNTEMIADTFAQPMVSSSTQGKSESAAQSLDCVAVKSFSAVSWRALIRKFPRS